MGDVITLPQKQPQLSGRCVCMTCRHTWEGTAPVGTVSLDCPSCDTRTGVWQNPCFADGQDLFTCPCGNEFFVVHPDRIMCARCGAAQTPWDNTDD